MTVRKPFWKSLFRTLSCVMFSILILTFAAQLPVRAEGTQTTEAQTTEAQTADTQASGTQGADAQAASFEMVIEDNAGLMTDAEKQELSGFMQPVTDYCNVAFCSTDYNEYGVAQEYGTARLYDLFGEGSDSIVFLIDMDTRNIQIITSGAVRKVITDSYCTSITDNTYSYASDGNYAKCAEEGFTEILQVYQGRHIAQPMRFVSSFLLALFLAIVINYIIVATYSKKTKVTAVQGMLVGSSIIAAGAVLNDIIRTYRVTHSSGGGGGSGGGGSFGGGGGGGTGGGGHGF
jgi:uncharacterized membrane protein YgcG